MKILVVEDDIFIGDLITELLSPRYQVFRAYSGTEALMRIERESFNLVLLDLMLPGISGEEILKKIKNYTKVIVISAKNALSDKVNNLIEGANDYITKPFDNEELLARVEVQLRGQGLFSTKLQINEISIDKQRHIVLVNNNELKLTKLEFDILKYLMENPNHVFAKSQIFEHVWEYDAIGNEDSVKVHISNLRNKIAEYSENKYIDTVWGIGFRFLN